MAAAGVVAAGIASLAFLPAFLLIGGNAPDYLGIVVFDCACVAAMAFVGGGYLAGPHDRGSTLVGRAVKASFATWLVVWAFMSTGAAIVTASANASWGNVGMLVAGVFVFWWVAAVLLSPVPLAFALQLWLAAVLWLRGSGIVRARGGIHD